MTQLIQFVGRDVINKNTTDLAVRCSIGSVELSCVAIDTRLLLSTNSAIIANYYICRLKAPFWY